jgi:NADPH:quinone reductase-like Zn-dependent oxidoreductase
MAKVVRFHETGGPDRLDAEADLATAGFSRRQILDAQHLALNGAETLFPFGQYLEPAKLPARIGYEAAVVDAVGEGVEAFQPGEALSVVPAFSMNE